MQAAKNFQASKKEEKLKKQKSIAEKRTQIIINKALKEKTKLNRSSFAAEKRRLKNETLQTKAVERQAQNELKIMAARFKQLIVRLKLSNKDVEGVMNDQTKVIYDEGEMTTAKEEDEAILITSRGRRVRSSKFHDT